MPYALKVLLSPKELALNGTKLELKEGENPVGRISPPSAIVLNSPKVSKLHCTFRVNGSSVSVEDHNSSNGLYVNGKKVVKAQLKEKDRLVIGEFTLEVTVKA